MQDRQIEEKQKHLITSDKPKTAQEIASAPNSSLHCNTEVREIQSNQVAEANAQAESSAKDTSRPKNISPLREKHEDKQNTEFSNETHSNSEDSSDEEFTKLKKRETSKMNAKNKYIGLSLDKEEEED